MHIMKIYLCYVKCTLWKNSFVRLVGHVSCLVTSDELLDVLEQFPHSPLMYQIWAARSSCTVPPFLNLNKTFWFFVCLTLKVREFLETWFQIFASPLWCYGSQCKSKQGSFLYHVPAAFLESKIFNFGKAKV